MPVAPLNIKKKVKQFRRRGIVSGVHLQLPSSPRPVPTSPLPEITFTAEWDLDQNTFVFTPLDNTYPRSAVSSEFPSSLIPVNVDEDSSPCSSALSSPSIYSFSSASPRHPRLPVVETAWSSKEEVAESASPDSSRIPYSPTHSSPSTPVSPIFDRESIYSHGRKLSQSTTASSIVDDEDDCAVTSPATICRVEALHVFKKELNRFVPVTKVDDHKTGSGCYDAMDRDLLLAPMEAFEQSLWNSTEAESQAVQRRTQRKPVKARPIVHKPLPDVPRSAESNTSRFSSDSEEVRLQQFHRKTARAENSTLYRALKLTLYPSAILCADNFAGRSAKHFLVP